MALWSPCTVRQRSLQIQAQTCWPSLLARLLYPRMSARSRPKECPGHTAKPAPTQEISHHHAAGWASQALAERDHYSLPLPLGNRFWSCCCQAGKTEGDTSGREKQGGREPGLSPRHSAPVLSALFSEGCFDPTFITHPALGPLQGDLLHIRPDEWLSLGNSLSC